MADTQCRKWQLTINNPGNCSIDHEIIKKTLEEYKSLQYFVMSDEIGLETKTYHTHIFVYFKSAVRFSTIKKSFSAAHIESAKGTCQQNKDYIFKEGKWEKDRKKETNISDSHYEFGDMPIEHQGERNDLNDLYDMINSGMTTYDIIQLNPSYMLQLDKIDRVRQLILEEKYKKEFRTLDVTYISGETGTGKTRYVMEKYGYNNVYRITDYNHPWDSYKGQNIVLFEEFRSSLKIQDMLNYLDGYPLELPCRYNNKRACFNIVYIITNIALEEQYREVQDSYSETWSAFLRRIKRVCHVQNGKLIEDFNVKDILNAKVVPIHKTFTSGQLQFK